MFSESDRLRKRAHTVIPGGCHTYAKGDDQYPERSPGFIARGKGCHVWDVDGNEFIEYGMGMRAVTLGHAYEPVVEAAYRQMRLGANFTRPAPIEIELAEEMAAIIGCAEMVKFGKNGSDATSAAVRLARSFTDRDRIAVCSSHPFFSVDDWFIGTTVMSSGIPREYSRLILGFRYNDIESLRALFDENPGRIACVLMEPARAEPPAAGFLEDVRDLCNREGAVLVFDEMITGFRLDLGGGQEYYGVTPDLATFGKAMGNGFSVAALCGKRDIMRLGGLDHEQERVFLLSLTHGAETHGLAAALETIHTYRRHDVIGALDGQGRKLARGIEAVTADLDLKDHFGLAGMPCNLVYFTRGPDGEPSQAFRTLFLQEMIGRGVICPSFVVSWAHHDNDIQATVEAVHGALEVYRRALDDGIERHLQGRAVKPVFRRFN